VTARRDAPPARRAAPPVVRAATRQDVDAIHAIEVASFADPWTHRSFVSLLSEPAVYFHVAEAPDGGVAGYVVAWCVVDEAEIANVAVAPAARGTGMGASLLDAALAHAAGRGCLAAYLEVRESNAPARALYASRGFGAVGRRRGYYRHPVEDALVLRCALVPRTDTI
jgi:[ribosomal protein S18]-alanine N-acetyltransferase